MLDQGGRTHPAKERLTVLIGPNILLADQEDSSCDVARLFLDSVKPSWLQNLRR